MTLLVGHVIRKIVSEMTYNVSSVMLNSTLPTLPYLFFCTAYKLPVILRTQLMHLALYTEYKQYNNLYCSFLMCYN